MPVTATQLCLLAGITHNGFETWLRRGKLDSLFDADGAKGAWTRYDFCDLLNLGAVVELKRFGLTLDTAVGVVSNNATSDAFAMHHGTEAFFVATYQLGNSDPSRAHKRGARSEVLASLPNDATAIVLLDVTALARSLVARAAELGFVVHENDITRGRHGQ
jgi:hypothetical protein